MDSSTFTTSSMLSGIIIFQIYSPENVLDRVYRRKIPPGPIDHPLNLFIYISLNICICMHTAYILDCRLNAIIHMCVSVYPRKRCLRWCYIVLQRCKRAKKRAFVSSKKTYYFEYSCTKPPPPAPPSIYNFTWNNSVGREMWSLKVLTSNLKY